MATQTKEKPKAEVAKTPAEQQQSLTISKTISKEEAAKMLNDAEAGEVDSGYLQFESGEPRRVVFMGWKNIPGMGENKGKEVPAVVFVTDSGKEQINADAVIVSYFQKQQEGHGFEIVCTGMKTSPKGDYKNFEFRPLKANLKK